MSTTLYAPISQAVSNEAVTKPLQQISIPNRFGPVNWGPRWNAPTDYNAPHIELFQPPAFHPARVPAGHLEEVPPFNDPDTCPLVPILYRNHWETFNVNRGGVYGGYDYYSSQNIPSCSERSGDHMNFMDFTKPWARVLVNEANKNDYWAWDSHSGQWAKTINRELEEREMK